MTVEYEIDHKSGGCVCLTKCPFNLKNDANQYIHVMSLSCTNCKNFIQDFPCTSEPNQSHNYKGEIECRLKNTIKVKPIYLGI